jgi:hypothetical protein
MAITNEQKETISQKADEFVTGDNGFKILFEKTFQSLIKEADIEPEDIAEAERLLTEKIRELI